MKYRLYHYHKGMWWEAGERSAEQIEALRAVCDWSHKVEGEGEYFRITKLWKDEPNWLVKEA